MPTCPQCRKPVPLQGLFTSARSFGIACPNCSANIEPTRLSQTVTTVLALAAGFAASRAMRAAHFGYFARCLAILVVACGVWFVAAQFVLRLRIRKETVTTAGPLGGPPPR